MVVLVSMDTTRADRLGPYGHPNAGTPTLDALAARGVVFEQAMAPASTTLVSHTAVMSGRDSHQSGVVRNGYPVPPGLPLLAERFADEGWDTLAVVGATPLEDAMGLDRGFRVWEDHDMVPYLGKVEVGADVVNQRVFELLEEAGRPKPTLLFVHYYDPHMPWTSAPRETLAEHVPADLRKNGFVIKGVPVQRGPVTEADVAEAQGRYQAEIAWTDSQLGELLAGLERRGWGENQLVVVFSDHGESLGDNPNGLLPFGHGPDVDKAIVHVPLIVAGTGDFEIPTTRVSQQARLVDLGTTLLALTDLGGALGEGRDLTPSWSGGTLTSTPSFAEATKPIEREAPDAWNNLPFQRSVAQDGALVIVTPLQRSVRVQDLTTGAYTDDETTARSRVPLLEAWDEAAPPHREPDMSDATISALKQLGYLE